MENNTTSEDKYYHVSILSGSLRYNKHTFEDEYSIVSNIVASICKLLQANLRFITTAFEDLLRFEDY